MLFLVLGASKGALNGVGMLTLLPDTNNSWSIVLQDCVNWIWLFAQIKFDFILFANWIDKQNSDLLKQALHCLLHTLGRKTMKKLSFPM